jgi:hypothetical protein
MLIGQPQIEQDAVVFVDVRERKPVAAIRRDIDGEPFLFQNVPSQECERRIILDE